METTVINRPLKVRTDAHKISKKNESLIESIFSQAFWDAADFNRFGIVPAVLTIVTCLSAIAAACAVYNGLPQLILVAAPTALFLATIIAVAPMRIILALAVITAIVDFSVFLYH